MVHFGEFLKTWSLRSNSVTRHVSFNRTKIGGKCQNCKKFKCDILSNFQTMWDFFFIVHKWRLLWWSQKHSFKASLVIISFLQWFSIIGQIATKILKIIEGFFPVIFLQIKFPQKLRIFFFQSFFFSSLQKSRDFFQLTFFRFCKKNSHKN